MAKGYWITAYRKVSDPEKLAAYAKLAGPALLAAGGRFLARGTASEVHEAGLLERTVLIEFDSVEKPVPPMKRRHTGRHWPRWAMAPNGTSGSWKASDKKSEIRLQERPASF